MELRTAASPKDVKFYTTERLRQEFLIEDLFRAGEIKLVYSHIDRIITGSAVPTDSPLVLTAGDELRAQYFCERRELGVINIGGNGTIRGCVPPGKVLPEFRDGAPRVPDGPDQAGR